jgi:hypothetical protein
MKPMKNKRLRCHREPTTSIIHKECVDGTQESPTRIAKAAAAQGLFGNSNKAIDRLIYSAAPRVAWHPPISGDKKMFDHSHFLQIGWLFAAM